jgi:hemolysin activation/secretion protein
MRLNYSGSLLSASLFLTSYALAAAPDAGSLQQEILREREAVPGAKAAPKEEKRVVPEKPMTGQRFIVREFVFEGNTLLTGEQLTQALAACLGTEVDFDRLKACAALVTERYQSSGWVAKSVLPEQDVIDGKVKIVVIEAKFGTYVFPARSAARVSKAQLQGIFDAQQKSGELLSMEKLDRALLLADDLPGVGVTANLDQGAEDGSTNMVIQLADEPLVSGNASIDNHGSLSTGTRRLNASLNTNSPLEMGDLFTLSVMRSDGNRYLRMEETLPLGYHGLRVGINTSYLSYKLTDPRYAGLDANGTATTVGLSSSFPVIRSREKNLNLSMNLDRKNYTNMSGGESVSDYLVKTLSIGLDGTIFDEFFGGGANYGTLTATSGYKDLSGSSNQLSDALSANTQGHFQKFRYSVSRQQKIDAEWSAFFNYSGQVTRRNLDSSESFYLGGNSGVRAYPSNEGRGSEGQLVTLEIRARLSSGFSWVGFYDWGRVLGYPNNNFVGAADHNVTVLQGYGMSVTWQASKGSTLKASWATRIGSNSNATVDGKDQDGTLVRNRFWLSASLPY